MKLFMSSVTIPQPKHRLLNTEMPIAHMFIAKAEDVDERSVEMEGARDITIRWLIDPKVGAENFAMRLFRIEKDGCTPYHQHDWEHEVFVLQGDGIVRTEEGDHKLGPRSVLFMPSGKWHQFLNAGPEDFEFLCLIPNSGMK